MAGFRNPQLQKISAVNKAPILVSKFGGTQGRMPNEENFAHREIPVSPIGR